MIRYIADYVFTQGKYKTKHSVFTDKFRSLAVCNFA